MGLSVEACAILLLACVAIGESGNYEVTRNDVATKIRAVAFADDSCNRVNLGCSEGNFGGFTCDGVGTTAAKFIEAVCANFRSSSGVTYVTSYSISASLWKWTPDDCIAYVTCILNKLCQTTSYASFERVSPVLREQVHATGVKQPDDYRFKKCKS